MFKNGEFIKVRGISVGRIHAMAISMFAAKYYTNNACLITDIRAWTDGRVSYRLRSPKDGDWWVTGEPNNFYQDNECLMKDQS